MTLFVSCDGLDRRAVLAVWDWLVCAAAMLNQQTTVNENPVLIAATQVRLNSSSGLFAPMKLVLPYF
jgi:hypothetical protein